MRTFRSGEVEIAYVDLPGDPAVAPGRGAPIVLVHGFASTHAVNWVNTLWTKTLGHAGYRVIAPDNRGHGRSGKPHDPSAYATSTMAGDVAALLDHLALPDAVVMGYSMGARIVAFTALEHPSRVRAALLGGLGIHLVRGVGLPLGIAEAMEAPALESLTDPTQRMFRAFAEANGQDLLAMAACIRGTRQTLSEADVARIAGPVLVSVGTKDSIAGSARDLAALIPRAEWQDIPGRDHNLAVGDRNHKAGVLDFLAKLPA